MERLAANLSPYYDLAVWPLVPLINLRICTPKTPIKAKSPLKRETLVKRETLKLKMPLKPKTTLGRNELIRPSRR